MLKRREGSQKTRSLFFFLQGEKQCVPQCVFFKSVPLTRQLFPARARGRMGRPEFMGRNLFFFTRVKGRFSKEKNGRRGLAPRSNIHKTRTDRCSKCGPAHNLLVLRLLPTDSNRGPFVLNARAKCFAWGRKKKVTESKEKKEKEEKSRLSSTVFMFLHDPSLTTFFARSRCGEKKKRRVERQRNRLGTEKKSARERWEKEKEKEKERGGNGFTDNSPAGRAA